MFTSKVKCVPAQLHLSEKTDSCQVKQFHIVNVLPLDATIEHTPEKIIHMN